MITGYFYTPLPDFEGLEKCLLERCCKHEPPEPSSERALSRLAKVADRVFLGTHNALFSHSVALFLSGS